MSPQTAQAPGSIRVLPESLSARIAAGEVVERPASVVKELVENSLDAGARRIDVEVREGGRALIRVDDDGRGIPSDQIAIAFERFATSKIDEGSDLAAISTLGFRGEALPSIASVSHVEATSRAASENAGSRVLISFGEVQNREAFGRPVGTSVVVRDLFRNVPARMRFLASQGAELGRIQRVVASYALVRPEVAFTLQADGSERIVTSGRGDLIEAASAVYDTRVAEALLELNGPEAGDPLGSSRFAVAGALAAPSVSRGNRNYMTLSVNGRWVHSRRLSFAVEQAYHGFLEERRFPIAALRLEVPAGDVNVNVHPAKTEVKFLREQLLFSAIQRAVREVLLASSPVPVFTVPDKMLGAPSSRPIPTTANPLWPDPLAATPMDVLGKSQAGGPVSRPGDFGAPSREADRGPTPHGAMPGMRVIGQAQEMYLITEGPDGVYLIDQHAAHERVLFEEIGDRLERSETESQQLLAPEAVELQPQQEESYAAHGELLEKLGYSIELFGPHTVLIRAVPAPMGGPAAAEGLLRALDSLAEGGSPARWKQRLIASMACHAAVTAGRRMEPEESRELVRRLELTRQPHTCPHARPTMIRLSSAALEREFKRS